MPGPRRGDERRPIVTILLAVDTVLGLAIAATGYFLLENDAVALVGAGLATLGVSMLLFYQITGQRG